MGQPILLLVTPPAAYLRAVDLPGNLLLSPKTVEHHLASVFRKRGFRSRTELASAFARAAEQR
jgi:hypothetical protein